MPEHTLDPIALDRAFDVAARRVHDGTIPFVILGVANGAGTIRLEAVSPPDAPRIGSDAVCLLASITKPIVATATMRLAQEGRFGIEVPLSTWLPELRTDDGRETITAWHVMTHTTGLEDAPLEDLLRQGLDRAGLLARTFAQPPSTPPGSTFRYATFTWELLAVALERALDRPLEAILRETVFDPLGMADSGFEPGPGRAGRIAPVTIGEWDGTRLTGTEDAVVAAAMRERFTSLRLAGGGLWSTASDLLRLGRAMVRGGELDGQRILAPAFWRLATREVTLDGLGAATDRLEAEHYAIGWGKPGPTSPASAASFGHGGASGTRLWVDPEHDVVVVYLTGSWGLPSVVIDETVAAVYAAVR